MKKSFLTSTLLALLFSTSSAMANVVAPLEADNSAQNVRDRAGKNLTPQDQTKGTRDDVNITRAARQLLVKDRTLSTNAKNVKIITVDHVMTLRGPVNSQTEKEKVLEHAKASATNIQVIDKLEIINK